MTETITDRRAADRGATDRRRHPRDPFVEFQDLHKAYGSKHVLRGASLKVYRGEVLVILGGSGTGKSVTLRHMLGLEAPDAGRVIVEEEDITDLPEEELYRIRKKFGMLFQSGALFDSMTVFENVAFPLREHTEMSDEEISRAVREKLELVNLPNTEHLMPVDLSGGMRKRVGLARSIVLDPQVILYDEPTTGLDPITAQTINELIVDLQAKLNVTSVVVTHDIHSAFSVGDRIAFLHQGVFEWVGSMDQARDSDNPRLRDFLRASAVVAAQPSNVARPPNAAQPSDTERPADAAQPSNTTRPANAVQPANTARSADAAEPANTARSADAAEPANTARSADAAEPSKE